jgi:hypothetical protein
MSVKKVNDLLSEKEVAYFDIITNSLKIPVDKNGEFIYDEDTGFSISETLGRLQFTFKKNNNKELITKLKNIAESFLGFEVDFMGANYVEYSPKYGTPDLPPHFDGDSTDLIINYQLKSNTSWDVGVNEEIYKMEDNSAIMFNPNKDIHWRSKKIFEAEEFVKMIFFRFGSLKNPKDNSHLRYSLDNKVYKDVNAFRDSIV